MARKWYGTAPSDVVVQQVTDADAVGGKVYAPKSATYQAMTTRTGSTQHTDLLDVNGSAITTVVPASDGTIVFQGLDGYTGPYWLRDAAAPSARRIGPLTPDDIVERIQTLEGVSGTYIAPTVFDAAGDLIVGTGSDTYAKLTKGAANTQIRVKADGTTLEYFTPGISNVSGLQAALDAKADTFDELGDVAATSPVDGAIPQFDTADNLWHAVDASSQFATVDSTGRLAPADYPQGFMRMAVINPGGSLPSYIQSGDLVWVRDTVTASLDLVNAGTANNASTSASTLNVTNSATTYATGDYAVACVTISAEATFPTAFTMTGPTNIGSMTLAPANPSVQGSTAATLIFYARATGAVASSQTFTFTDTGGTASRSDIAIRLLKLTGLTTTSVIDQSTAGGAASQATMNIGPITTTTANQIAVACFGYNPTTGGTFAPASGWTQVGTPVASTDAAPRAVAVVWRILSAAGNVTATGTVTTGVTWAGSLATFKGA